MTYAYIQIYVYIFIYRYKQVIISYHILHIPMKYPRFLWQVQAHTGGVGVDAILALDMDLSPEDRG